MAEISEDAKSQLVRIQKNIETAYIYFQDNYKRFREYKRYVFKETINQQQRTMMQNFRASRD